MFSGFRSGVNEALAVAAGGGLACRAGGQHLDEPQSGCAGPGHYAGQPAHCRWAF